MKESRRAVFTDMFYSLLNFKSEKFVRINIETKKGALNGTVITNLIFKEFSRLIDGKWKNLEDIEQDDIKKEFQYFVAKITEGKGYEQIYNYFYMYESLYFLINNEDLSDSDKLFYKDLVSNSMEVGEQLTLLWIAGSSDYHCNFLKDSKVFPFGMSDDILPFADKFLHPSLFAHALFIEKLEDYKNKKTPA